MNFSPYELSRSNRLHTNIIRYEILESELYPIRTFNIANFCRYKLFFMRTLSHTNIRMRTFAYEPFPIRTLCSRTLVLEAGVTASYVFKDPQGRAGARSTGLAGAGRASVVQW